MDRQTAVARKHVEDAETAIMLEQEDMWNAENAGSTATKPETIFEEMLNAIGNRVSNLARFDDREDGEYENDDDEYHPPGNLSKDDNPDWATGTLFKTVQHWIECCQQK